MEDHNAVEAEITVAIVLDAHNHLHSSSVDVKLSFQPKLMRLCEEPIRLTITMVDCIVMAFSILASIAYSMSVIRAVRLAKVRIMTICDHICEDLPFSHILHTRS